MNTRYGANIHKKTTPSGAEQKSWQCQSSIFGTGTAGGASIHNETMPSGAEQKS